MTPTNPPSDSPMVAMTASNFLVMTTIATIAFLFCGWLIGMTGARRATLQEAIEHGCARHNPTTGEIEWTK